MSVTRTVVLGLFAVCAISSRTLAQDPAPGASVEGDVYLTMQSGDVRKGAGQTVYLLSDTPLLHEGRDSVCVHNVFDRLPLAAQRAAADDSMNKERNDKRVQQFLSRDVALSMKLDTVNRNMRAQIDRLIVQSVRDTTSTGMNAHYRFENEPPGAYIVYATWKVGDNEYTWWDPVELRAGGTVKRDLNNSGAGGEMDYLIYGGTDTMASRLYCVGPRIGVLPR